MRASRQAQDSIGLDVYVYGVCVFVHVRGTGKQTHAHTCTVKDGHIEIDVRKQTHKLMHAPMSSQQSGKVPA